LVAALVVNPLPFIFCVPVFAARQITTRQVGDGAIAAAISWQLLQKSVSTPDNSHTSDKG
jgi:hypothetical protein